MISNKLYKQIKLIIYLLLILVLPISYYKWYQNWLNPLGLKLEENPKQHDGSQEFNPAQEWESSIQPAPDEDGVRRYLPPKQLENYGKEETK